MRVFILLTNCFTAYYFNYKFLLKSGCDHMLYFKFVCAWLMCCRSFKNYYMILPHHISGL